MPQLFGGYDQLLGVMIKVMSHRASVSLSALFLAAGGCWGQSHYLVVTLPRGADSERVFLRYMLDDQFGGWVQPSPGVSSYLVNTNQQGRPATRIKAVIYAHGCAIQTLDLPVADSETQRYSFVCQPVSSVSITGRLSRTDLVNAGDVKIEARYVTQWVEGTAIPMAETGYFLADGSFRLSLPGLSRDGDFQILAVNRTGGQLVAQLVPESQALRNGMGYLRIQTEYPAEVRFGVCSNGQSLAHDAFGFAVRGSASPACDH